MAVYFVLRSHYDEPSGKLLRRFDDATVLEWFRNRWTSFDPDDCPDQVYRLLGFYVDPFINLFRAVTEAGLPIPAASVQLEEYLRGHCAAESAIRFTPHALAVMSVDSVRMEMCSYLFDDDYLSEYTDQAAFLLHEGWQLPKRHSRAGVFEPTEPVEPLLPDGHASGTTYCIVLHYEYDNDGPLSDLWGPHRIEGLRLPDLAAHLALHPEIGEESQFLHLLRSQLFLAPFTEDPQEEGFRQELLDGTADLATLAAYADWLQERHAKPLGLLALEQAFRAIPPIPVPHVLSDFWLATENEPIGVLRKRLVERLEQNAIVRDQLPYPNNSKLHVGPHLAQLCHATEHWRSHHRTDLYHQWILFDDRWAAAHPALANAILRYARRWDVLSPDGPNDNA